MLRAIYTGAIGGQRPEPDPPHHRRSWRQGAWKHHRRLCEHIITAVRHLWCPGRELGRTPPTGYSLESCDVIVIRCSVGVDSPPIRKWPEGFFGLIPRLRELRFPSVHSVVIGVYKITRWHCAINLSLAWYERVQGWMLVQFMRHHITQTRKVSTSRE